MTDTLTAERLRVGPDELVIHVETERLLAFDVHMPAGGGPPGLHRHAAEEVYRVLERHGIEFVG